MTSARAQEVLYDSETVLRLVDRELAELRDPSLSIGTTSPNDAGVPDRRAAPETLPPDAMHAP